MLISRCSRNFSIKTKGEINTDIGRNIGNNLYTLVVVMASKIKVYEHNQICKHTNIARNTDKATNIGNNLYISVVVMASWIMVQLQLQKDLRFPSFDLFI